MHRSDLELLDHLYGIAAPDAHLDRCPDCRERLEAMRAVRRGMVDAESRVSLEFLAAQRSEIWKRIEKPSWQPRLVRPLSAAAAVLVLVIGFFVWGRYPQSPAAGTYSDEQLLSDVAADVETAWPRNLESVAGRPHVARADSTLDSRLFDEIQHDLSGEEPRAAVPMRGLYTETD